MLRRGSVWQLCVAIGIGALATRSPAVDHIVEIRCVEDSTGLTYRSDRDPVVIAAGSDRIVFTLPNPYSGPCWENLYFQTFGVDIWPSMGIDFRMAWISPPAGPFCEAGTRRYGMGVGEGHGIPLGYFDLGVIEVTPPSEPPSGASAAPLIGVYADPTATSCKLPGSPGRHRAYACARFAGATGRPSYAEFRVAGFPSEWPILVSPAAARDQGGSLLVEGVGTWIWPPPAPSASVVVLYLIEYEPTTPAANATVRVEAAHLFASSHPKLYFDSEGAVEEVCAIGGIAYLGEAEGPCAVAVQSATWGGVKSLYRDPATR